MCGNPDNVCKAFGSHRNCDKNLEFGQILLKIFGSVVG